MEPGRPLLCDLQTGNLAQHVFRRASIFLRFDLRILDDAEWWCRYRRSACGIRSGGDYESDSTFCGFGFCGGRFWRRRIFTRRGIRHRRIFSMAVAPLDAAGLADGAGP